MLPLPTGEPRRILFAGKGGVGKTSLACAAALWAADAGLRTLLVTTDPAAHIGAVLQARVGDEPAPVAGVTGLDAVRVDAHMATALYRDSVLEDAARRFDTDTVTRIAQELDSPCTEEVAVFQRFLEHILDRHYQVTVLDTAPTGHTLRLLQLPVEYAEQLAAKVHGSSEGALLDAAQQERMAQALAVLRSPATTLAFVVYPETTPIAEARRASEDLEQIGIRTAWVVINQVLPPEACTGPFFHRRRQLQMEHLDKLPSAFPGSSIVTASLQSEDIRGLDALRSVGREMFGTPRHQQLLTR